MFLSTFSFNTASHSFNVWNICISVSTAITCSPLDVPNATDHVTYSPVKLMYSYLDTVNYTCDPGYQQNDGDFTSSCEDVDTWSGVDPSCIGTNGLWYWQTRLLCLEWQSYSSLLKHCLDLVFLLRNKVLCKLPFNKKARQKSLSADNA